MQKVSKTEVTQKENTSTTPASKSRARS